MNTDIVYRALAVVEFASPPYAAPGGTVYAPGGQIYYPMGVSWGIRRPATFVGVDAFCQSVCRTRHQCGGIPGGSRA